MRSGRYAFRFSGKTGGTVEACERLRDDGGDAYGNSVAGSGEVYFFWRDIDRFGALDHDHFHVIGGWTGGGLGDTGVVQRDRTGGVLLAGRKADWAGVGTHDVHDDSRGSAFCRA
jgi:hypothetical protein